MTIVNTGVSPAAMNGAARSQPTVQNASPASGATVNMSGGSDDVTLNLTPAGLLASLTVNLPSSPQIGDKARIVSTQTITTLNLGGAVSILGNPGTLLAAEALTFEYTQANTWMRI